MSTVTITRQGVDVLVPRVNLLPAEIAEAARFKRMQVGMGCAVAGAVGVVAVLAMLSASQVASAQEGYAAAQAQGATLQTQINALAEVPKTGLKLEAAQAQLALAMGAEVKWSNYLTDLSLTIPDDVGLKSLNIDQATAGAPAGAGIATIKYSGQTKTLNDVAVFLDALAKQKAIVDPYATQASWKKDDSFGKFVYDFEATSAVTDAALSGRYTKKVG